MYPLTLYISHMYTHNSKMFWGSLMLWLNRYASDFVDEFPGPPCSWLYIHTPHIHSFIVVFLSLGSDGFVSFSHTYTIRLSDLPLDSIPPVDVSTHTVEMVSASISSRSRLYFKKYVLLNGKHWYTCLL